MTLLPIAARELAVAARRPGTYWLRACAALVAVVLFGVTCRSRVSPGLLGHQILAALGVATLGFCMLAGLLLTADSIASEKETGTLGLLFLTDLKGYDVVLGKLAANSINGFLGLLAMFPVLGLPLLIGGVTGSEFSRLALVFGSTLLFSLSLGLAVSASTGNSTKALGWAIILMAAVAGLLPALWCFHYLGGGGWLDVLLWPSPAFAFRYAFDAYYRTRVGSAQFWISVQTIWLMIAFCLVWANHITPRAWHMTEQKLRQGPARRRKPRGWQQVEAEHPYGRVTILDRAPSSLANLLLAVGVPVWLCFYCFIPSLRPRGAPVPFLVCMFLGYGLHLAVKLLAVVESVARPNHDRDSGALELLLATPLPEASIMEAQRQAQRAHFRPAFWTLGLLNLALWAAIFNFDEQLSIRGEDREIFAVVFIGGIVALFADFEAVLWVGAWHGLSKRKPYKAMAFSVAQLLGPNWLIVFLLIFTEPVLGQGAPVFVVSAWFAVGLLVDFFSFTWARERLRTRFRLLAAQRYDKPD